MLLRLSRKQDSLSRLAAPLLLNTPVYSEVAARFVGKPIWRFGAVLLFGDICLVRKEEDLVV